MADIPGTVGNKSGLDNKGELAKFTLHSWDTVSKDDKGNLIRPHDIGQANNKFEAYINPDEFTINYKVHQDDKQPLGSTGSVGTFLGVYPLELSVKFYLDATKVTGRELNFSDSKQEDK